MKTIYSFFLFVVFLAACKSSQQATGHQDTKQNFISIEGKLFATAFIQRSAEYHALCLQAFNIARLRLDESLKHTSSKPRAIITDVDETILDNSADEVNKGLRGIPFNTVDWYKWTAKAAADTIPGALNFLKYAASKNVEIFYITNRDEVDRAGTLQNLQHFGFPNADNAHLLIRLNTSGKEARRHQVMADHDVILLLGDNLSDFSMLFDKKSVEERLQSTKELANEFGNRFIVLPNPVYGDWELALYQYKQLSSAQKDSAIKSLLKGY